MEVLDRIYSSIPRHIELYIYIERTWENAKRRKIKEVLKGTDRFKS